jgi:hypothetical protein
MRAQDLQRADDLQITPIGPPPRHLVHVLKVFLIIAYVAMNVARPRRRTLCCEFVRVHS